MDILTIVLALTAVVVAGLTGAGIGWSKGYSRGWDRGRAALTTQRNRARLDALNAAQDEGIANLLKRLNREPLYPPRSGLDARRSTPS